MKKNQHIQILITDLVYGGEGLGRYQDCVVFVPWTVPGDEVLVLITQKKKHYARGKVLKFIKESNLRIDPPCPMFSKCGGCRWQNMDYNTQLKYKKQIVENHLKIDNLPIIKAPDPFYYRNKMEFTFAEDDNGKILLGLHEVGKFYNIVSLKKCFLQAPEANQILESIQTFLSDTTKSFFNKIKPYNKRSHEGILRYLIFRNATSGIVVNLVTNDILDCEQKIFDDFSEQFVAHLKQFPHITGIIWSISESISDAVKITKEKLLYGVNYLEEKISNTIYRFDNKSFFQTNTAATKILYDIVKEYFLSAVKRNNWGKKLYLLDLYCGVGSIGLYLAEHVEKVIGVELVPEAIEQAKVNAKLNNYSHCHFFKGDVQDILRSEDSNKELLASEKIKILTIDPPRSGITKKALKAIINKNIPVIIYVSCNPTTLARDLEVLKEADYNIEKITLVDMFPQTYHVENVVLLIKS